MQRQLTPPYFAVAILMDGSHHLLTEKIYEQICNAQKDDFIQPYPFDPAKKMTMFRAGSITEILGMDDYRTQYPQRSTYGYGQPFSDQKYLNAPVSKKSLREHMEDYIAKHPNDKATAKFYSQFKKSKLILNQNAQSHTPANGDSTNRPVKK